MKVKELIAELEKLDPNKEIYGLCEDLEITKEKFVEIFSVERIDSVEVKMGRNSKGTHDFTLFPKEGGEDNYFLYLTNNF